ncbi:MAG: biopolymer transporter ExbD [Candidatus Marinimicrobia bacterium]|jgi:biopolymer transport protein ExbD|nr:biopolymer transporter ExbD [Candidatus Neomarinimicrobiota bacterium]
MFTEKKKKRETEIPSSSMSDIAFLLLVFFLVVSTVDQDKGVQMVLPPTGGELEINKKNITIVQINSEGKVLFDDEVVPLKQINVRTKNMITKNPKMIFSVQTDAKTKYQDYLSVIDQLKIADAKKISIAG